MLYSLFLKGENTPLLIASGNGHLDVVDKLLDKGANIEATNKVRKSWIVVKIVIIKVDLLCRW
jgi:ankyrin repeat protein